MPKKRRPSQADAAGEGKKKSPPPRMLVNPDLLPGLRERIEAAAAREGLDVPAFLRSFLHKHLPPLGGQPPATPADPGNGDG